MDTVITTIPVGSNPDGVAVNPTGKVYVTNNGDNTISVIDTATNTVTATVLVGSNPDGVAVNPAGTRVYVTNANSDTVSVIDTATNKVTATVPVGSYPWGVAVNPDGTKAYAVNYNSNTVSVIDTATNKVAATISVEEYPSGVAVSPTGTKAYVTNNYNVSVIDTTTNKVTATVPVGSLAWGIAVNPDGTKVYVTNSDNDTVSVIDTATNKVTATVPVGSGPEGIAVNPDGTKVYVANYYSGTISVINTTTNNVTATINIGYYPVAFGQFIGSVPVPEPVIPVANFSSNVTAGYAPLSVKFVDISKNATEWKWDFGDGTTSTQQSPVHKYSKAGTYTVNLTVKNAEGSNTTIKTDYIKVTAKPVANFTSSVTSGKVPLNVVFTDTSTGTPAGWKWNFGDGTTSTQQKPTHKYSKAGTYTVNLTVKNAAGSNTATKTDYISVTEKPVANFTSSVTSGKLPLSVTFTDKSTGTPTKWKWSFGDGTTSTQQNPIHKYSKAGTYTVNLTVTNTIGSITVTKTNYIKVVTKPVADFTSSVTSGKAPINIAFSDTSTETPIKWQWNFGDGTTSTQQNPIHKYSKAGTYTVNLTVTNAAGSNTATKTNYIKVIEKPIAAISAKSTS
ncbi:Chitin binding protein [Methanosarcina barkeri 3]|uniref:Chitin binding protein n=2 Tax=Methanosarcina barkeri TaxID=2208 RepID=A0A0E3WXG3_METBA|nr:Chitin binding protein [Methanosarcina barkeri 3]